MKLAKNVQKIAQAILLCLVSLTYCASALAVSIQEIPNPRQVDGSWVTDTAQILDSETKTTLNQIISRLEKKNGTEMAIVTVPDTSPLETPKQYATSLFNYWGIGKRGKDNGVLFLVSKGDRRVEIETGRGLQSKLPNFRVKKIIQENVLPYFREENFSAGTLSGTLELIRELKSQSDSNLGGLLVLVCLLMGGIGVLNNFIPFSALFSVLFLQPEGKSRTRDSKIYAIRCKVCYKPMTQVPQDRVTSQMSQPEKVGQALGSIRVEGWKCTNCHPELTDSAIHLRIHILDDSQFGFCPKCQELTLIDTRNVPSHFPLEQPNYEISDECQCCDYFRKDIVVPYTWRKNTFSGTSSSWWDAEVGSGGSCSDGGGGGDFGGGSSDGGGGGGDW